MKINYKLLKRKRKIIKKGFKNFKKNKNFNKFFFYMQALNYGRLGVEHFLLSKLYFTKNTHKLVFYKLFSFNWPITLKGNLPMGKGKGKINKYISAVRKGSLLFTLRGDFFSENLLYKVLKVLQKIFPINLKVLRNQNYYNISNFKINFFTLVHTYNYKRLQYKLGQKKRKKLYQRILAQNKQSVFKSPQYYQNKNKKAYILKKCQVLKSILNFV